MRNGHRRSHDAMPPLTMREAGKHAKHGRNGGGAMQKSIKRNMMMNIILTASDFIFPLIAYGYAARVLGAEGTGKVAFAQSITQYFLQLAMLGIPVYGLRECAKVRDDRERLSHTVRELLAMNLVSATAAYLTLGAAILAVPKLSRYGKLLAVVSSCIFLNAVGMEWLYQALEEYSYITIRSIAFKIASAGLTFALVRSSGDYSIYAFTMVFASSAGYAWNFVRARRYVSLEKNGHLDIRKHLKPVLTMFAASAAITIYANFDISMLGFIGSEHEVGLYSAALKVKSAILAVFSAVTSVLTPGMARCFQRKDMKELSRLAEISLRASMVLALPLAAFAAIFAEDVLLFACGDGFLGASSTLRVLMACIALLILTNVFGNQLLVSTGNERTYSQSVIVGLFINICLNCLMIPAFGAAGAAAATLVTELWNVFWMGRRVKEYAATLLKRINFRQYLVPLLASSFAGLLARGCVREPGVFWRLASGAAAMFGIYGGMLLIIKEPLASEQACAVMDKLGQFVGKRRG